MPSRFVRPETTVLHISNGDTLTVRGRLNAGEERAYFARYAVYDATGVTVNRLEAGMAVITAYLLDWSLTDDEGELVAIRGLSIADLALILDNLEPADFNEIQAAIDAHDDRLRAARVALKKTTTTESASSATFTSPSVVTGDTSGSPN